MKTCPNAIAWKYYCYILVPRSHNNYFGRVLDREGYVLQNTRRHKGFMFAGVSKKVIIVCELHT